MAENTIDIVELVRKRQGGDEALDFLREAVGAVVTVLMEAEVSTLVGAEKGERTTERLAVRNGYRGRQWDTRAGTLDLAIPKLRTGSYFPSFLEPRRRSEQALFSVIQQAYVEGVSTRRVDDLVRSMGCEGISKSQVSRICKKLDEVVEAFRSRPLDTGPYPYIWLDALTQKVREGGRVVNVAVAVATAVNAEGKRELLGLEVGATETGTFWLSFLRSLIARGLRGAQLVTSDAHEGLKEAIATVFQGAAWQRCRTHFSANVLTKVPRSTQPFVATIVRSIYQQSTSEEVLERHGAVVEQLRERFPEVSQMVDDAAPEILAFTGFPPAHWKQIWSNNPQERLNKEIRRRTDVVGIFPNRQSAIRLIGAVLAEQNDEWAVARRYLSEESMKPLFARALPPLPPPEVTSDSTQIAV